MRTASFHSSEGVTFAAEAIVVDGVENGDPSEDSFVSLDVLTAVYRRDDRPARLFSFNMDRDVAEELVRQLQRALTELPKPKPLPVSRARVRGPDPAPQASNPALELPGGGLEPPRSRPDHAPEVTLTHSCVRASFATPLQSHIKFTTDSSNGRNLTNPGE